MSAVAEQQGVVAAPETPDVAAPAHERSMDAAMRLRHVDATQMIDLGLLPDGLFEHCMAPLLGALGWRGEARHLIEAMPHLETLQSLNEFRLVLHRIGFRSSVDQLKASELSDQDLPVLILDGGTPLVALSRVEGEGLRVYDSALEEERVFPTKGARIRVCRVYSPLDGAAEAARTDDDANWFQGALSHMGRDFRFALWLTFAANILALTTPLFSMSVYNAVLPSDSLQALVFLAGLALLAILVESQLRSIRASVLSSGSARVNCAMVSAALARILLLPIALLERAPVSSQLNRLKQFENVFGIFNGGVANAMFDLPFTFVFLLAVWLIGGPLAWVPLVVIALFGLMTALLQPASSHAMHRAASARDREQSLMRETLAGIETVRSIDAESFWLSRVAQARRRTVAARLSSMFLEQLRQGMASFLTMIASVSTLCVGALLVMEGEMSVGSLVAVTMLGSRILMPAQTLFLAIHQLSSARGAARQINSLMRMTTERAIDKAPTIYRRFEGRIRMKELSFRFPKADDFALRGVTADSGAGEIIGVVGATGGGKSTLLKMIIGLYRPTGGKVFLDGLNLAQLDISELRAAVAYAPSEAEFFYGTIAQNMKLARSTATDEEIAAVFEELDLTLDESLFPRGLETRLSAAAFQRLPDPVRQKLSLARAFIKAAPVLLLDNPGVLLDAAGDAALRRALERRRGRCTIILATREPKHVALCDKVMLLVDGQLAGFKNVKRGPGSPPSAPQGGPTN